MSEIFRFSYLSRTKVRACRVELRVVVDERSQVNVCFGIDRSTSIALVHRRCDVTILARDTQTEWLSLKKIITGCVNLAIDERQLEPKEHHHYLSVSCGSFTT